ncbi:unnamed protein product [Orchesella dallaii]|uniref:Uncharacterized protein n=1 Tax=Orchesella dallaii TaxID=48710 RepID=A0ABP1RQT7_9HEXA
MIYPNKLALKRQQDETEFLQSQETETDDESLISENQENDPLYFEFASNCILNDGSTPIITNVQGNAEES